MHIGLIGPLGIDLFLDNIGDALIRMGHRVTFLGSSRFNNRGHRGAGLVDLAITAAPSVEGRLHVRLTRRAVDHGCDAVVNVEGSLAPSAVAALRRHHIPVALWFPDAVVNLGRAMCLAAPYTALFFKDPLLVQRLRGVLRLPAWYLPEACNPRWHRPIGEAGVEPHIAVVGNTYVSRLLLIRHLHAAGIPMVIYGGATARWARDLLPDALPVRPPVFREHKSRVFRSAAGVLNNLHPGEMHGVNCRLFEATGAGAAVLCEDRPALAELFDVGREVLAFRNVDELIDQAGQLIADARLTRDVGDAGSKRAHTEHTYEMRLGELLERLV